eukprot:334581-Prorocentrum_minimum.AAC.1
MVSCTGEWSLVGVNAILHGLKSPLTGVNPPPRAAAAVGGGLGGTGGAPGAAGRGVRRPAGESTPSSHESAPSRF